MMMTTFTGNGYRITFLTSRLVRMEYQEDNRFEDELTTCVRCRDFPEVEVACHRSAQGLELDTEHLHIVYNEGPFSSCGLSVSVKGGLTVYHSTWRYGEKIATLGGTARTLDEADGRIPMGDGVIAWQGFSVLDDSASMLLTEDGRFIPRKAKGIDLYFFGYGHDYGQCMKDYHRLTGAVPMLPRYALGNWWSRYHEYTEEGYLALMERFERAGIPLSVAVIDMDWHLTDVPYGSGWTGYTWNKKLFPDPRRFLEALHQRGMRTTLNLHPAGGVAPHEAEYDRFCAAVGRDPQQKQIIDFDPADNKFMRAYFEHLHHPLEAEGVDFWWIDWQQGAVCSVEGLDPLWVLNEQHYRDSQRHGERGMILSRYAGPGSHRCPVGFSGDTIMSWESLQFQPEFTATAANIGYPWWSHDIGGHMRGIRSDELSVRWLQFGVFSPIMRLHSSKMNFASKEPWAYGGEAEHIMTEYLRLRHRLIPYIYTAAERTHRLGEALVRPVYYRYPEAHEAYQVPNQYLFGQSLMVCPITQPMDQALQMACVTAWLPEGHWFDFETGQIYTGGRMLKLWRMLADYPVLAHEGAIVPMSENLRADKNPAELTLRVYAGSDGHFDMYEDDGVHLDGEHVVTHIQLDWQNRNLHLCAEGAVNLLPEMRIWHVECIGFADTQVSMDGNVLPAQYDASRNALCFSFANQPGQTAVITFAEAKIASDNWLARAERILHQAQTSNEEKERIWHLLNKSRRSASVLGTLQAICTTPGLVECLTEVVFAQDEK